VQDGRIVQVLLDDEGARQGENHAGLLFNLSMADPYSNAACGPSVDATAICDDLRLHGEAWATLSAFDSFSTHIRNSTDLSLNPLKHEAVWPYTDRVPSPNLIRALNDRDIPLRIGWTTMLGTAIGADHKAMSEWAAKEVELHKNLFHLITPPNMHPRGALQTLRAAIHTKPAHTFRGLSPSDSEAASIRWDELTTTAVQTIAHLPDKLEPLAQYPISAPLSHSGLGFVRAELTSVAAWCGAQALAARGRVL
jgi:hypothetical protein